MKNIISIFAALIIASGLFAQKIKVTESGDAVVVSVFETDISDVSKDWKSLMKKYDAKVDASKTSVIAKGAVIKSMSSGTFDVTATLEKIKDGEVKMVIVFDPIASADSKTPDRSSYMAEAKRIVQDFARKRSSESISDMADDAQKAYDKLQKQHDGFVKDNAGLADDIESYKKKITNAERDISMNKDKIEAKKKEIEAQKKVVDSIKEKQKALD